MGARDTSLSLPNGQASGSSQANGRDTTVSAPLDSAGNPDELRELRRGKTADKSYTLSRVARALFHDETLTEEEAADLFDRVFGWATGETMDEGRLAS